MWWTFISLVPWNPIQHLVQASTGYVAALHPCRHLVIHCLQLPKWSDNSSLHQPLQPLGPAEPVLEHHQLQPPLPLSPHPLLHPAHDQGHPEGHARVPRGRIGGGEGRRLSHLASSSSAAARSSTWFTWSAPCASTWCRPRCSPPGPPAQPPLPPPPKHLLLLLHRLTH